MTSKQTSANLDAIEDLNNLDTIQASNKGFELELRHPGTGKPLGQFVTVLGKDSDVFREAIKELRDTRTRKEAQAERRGKTIDPQTSDEREEEGVKLLAVCTVGFRNVKLDGEMLTVSVPNAIKLYTRMLFVRKQVDEAVGDLENFI